MDFLWFKFFYVSDDLEIFKVAWVTWVWHTHAHVWKYLLTDITSLSCVAKYATKVAAGTYDLSDLTYACQEAWLYSLNGCKRLSTIQPFC